MCAEAGCLEVIATTGDARLGGDDWNRAFMQWVLQQAPEDARQVLLVVGHSLALGPCTPTQSLHRQLPVVCSRSAVSHVFSCREGTTCTMCLACRSASAHRHASNCCAAVEGAKQRPVGEREESTIRVSQTLRAAAAWMFLVTQQQPLRRLLHFSAEPAVAAPAGAGLAKPASHGLPCVFTTPAQRP